MGEPATLGGGAMTCVDVRRIDAIKSSRNSKNYFATKMFLNAAGWALSHREIVGVDEMNIRKK